MLIRRTTPLGFLNDWANIPVVLEQGDDRRHRANLPEARLMRAEHIAQVELGFPVSEYPGKQSLGMVYFFRLLHSAEGHNRVTDEHGSKLNCNVHRFFLDFARNGA